jgi:hypothetical protein
MSELIKRLETRLRNISAFGYDLPQENVVPYDAAIDAIQEIQNQLTKANELIDQLKGETSYPDFLLELSKQLHEQDNRITSDPIFCVYYDEKVPTSEDYADDGLYEWFNHEESEVIGDDDDLIEYLNENHLEWLQNYATGEEVEVSDVTIDDLEWETLPNGIDKIHYLKKKHFVKASLTEAGAQQFIDRKQHDYSKLYIYAESMCYQWQMIDLRKWLLSLHKVQGE